MHRQIAGKLTGPVTKWLVLVFWILAMGVLGSFAGKLSNVQDNEASSWLPGSAESTQALNKLAAFQDPNDIPTVVVYQRADGVALTAADQATIQGDLTKFEALHGIVHRASFTQQPYTLAPDGKAAQLTVTFNYGKNGWNKMPDTAASMRTIADHDGLVAHVTGSGGQAADSAKAFQGLDSNLLIIAGSVVVLILLLTYRSPWLWALPVFSALVALSCAMGVVYLLAKHAGVTVNGQSQGILTVLVFGAGTDYALLLVARYREELRNHEDRHEAMAFALHRAAPAIIASALTVVIGMLCLTVARMNSTSGLGPVCAVGIGIGLLVMVTLLPALLVIFGRWFFWPARPAFGTSEPTTSGFWSRLGGRIAKRPRLVWAGTVAVLLIACLGNLTLDANGLTQEQQYTKQYDSITGLKIQQAHHLIDDGSPIMVAVDQAHGPAVAAAMQGIHGIGAPFLVPISKGGLSLVTAPVEADVTSAAAFDAVKAVRTAVHRVPGATVDVGGGSAILYDAEQASSHDNKVIIPLVLAVVMIILMLLLRAVLAPILLIGTVVLSFAAALGISAMIFQYGFGYTSADNGLPLFVFVFLVALGIDYNIFLMSRVREETLTVGTRQGSLVALSATGGVITSAGIVLAATFAVLTSMPLVAFVEIGVAVAIGVLLDTFVVRSVLVTALNLDLGGKIWWPGKLDRDPVIDPVIEPSIGPATTTSYEATVPQPS
jgi:RND superfamily putative drug exporter